uniref:hypothetical protein n=1 Tax=Thaumasiovibrio subtropicus TaxID=1891207 RepID=UPI000B353CC9|nr:hypothetical protein [Thaumasiovibrio subtropicus]
MRIAFDLDDLLIPTTQDFSVGSSKLPFPLSLLYREELRNEAASLLKELGRNHELWIYTTSLRSSFYIKSWFKIWGVRIDKAINQTEHDSVVRKHRQYSCYSKAPKYFGIDLMIDDSEGVGIECTRQGCQSLVLSPKDNSWAGKVRSMVK